MSMPVNNRNVLRINPGVDGGPAAPLSRTGATARGKSCSVAALSMMLGVPIVETM